MADLTTLQNVKNWLKIDGADNDEMLRRLVTACSAFMQQWMNRTIASTSYAERRNGPGQATTMVMGNYPMTAIATILIDGRAVPAGVNWGDPGYTFDEKVIYLAGGYTFSRGKGNVMVAYTAGYSSTPPDLEQACIDAISARWRERDRIGLISKGMAGETTSFSIKDFPSQVITLMNNYKKVVMV